MAVVKQAQKDLLVVDALQKYFPVRSGLFQKVTAWVQAVDGVSFRVREGETFGLVGESGCGKTTIGRTVLRLTPHTGGHVFFDGEDVFAKRGAELKALRRNMQIVFQDPYSSLDPRMPVGEIIGEGLQIHGIGNPKERAEIVTEMLAKVGLNPYHARRYPHEFSGGQRQRIGIARALALEPDFIVCDEAISALDVSIQAQVINLLRDLQEKRNLAYLFISHDLSVVEFLSDRVAVMYLGRIVETGPSDLLFKNPIHPYTKALLSAITVPDPTRTKKRILLPGDPPSPLNPPKGCRFHPRCPLAELPLCSASEPVAVMAEDGHIVNCHVEQRRMGLKPVADATPAAT